MKNNTTRRNRIIVAIASLAAVAALAVSPGKPPLSGVTTISSKGADTCAISTGGMAWCWGRNASGELGEGTLEGWLAAIGVVGFSSGVTSIAASPASACLTSGNNSYCWGNNTGYGATPGVTPNLNPPGVVTVVSGAGHSCALTTGSGVKCWGDDNLGQLGNGTTSQFPVFTPVDVTGLTSGAAALAAGWSHTCARTTGGAAKCWGSGTAGQLGNGFSVDAHAPVDVTGLSSGVSALSAGVNHTCALTSAGGVKCWGAWPQLGNVAITTNQSIPVDVPGLTSGVTAIAAGSYHTCALLTAGNVMCWGANGSGQLGNNSTTDSVAPVSTVALGGTVTALSAGELHTCAVIGGGVECWGDNSLGQLGNNTTTSSLTPVTVLTLVDTVPDAFGFNSTTGVDLFSNQYSNTIIPTGFDRDVPISVSNGYYSVGCNGGWASAPDVFFPGESVCVFHQAATTGGASVTTTLTIGGTSGTFTSTTGIFPTTTTVSGPVTSTPGSLVTFNVSVTGQSFQPKGDSTITFKDNGTAITGCSALTIGMGFPSCSTSTLTAGIHSITAEYSGDSGSQPSTSLPFMHGVGTSTATLTISRAGAGHGTVASTSAAGIDCGSTCSATFPAGINVTLVATPAGDSTFTSWTGCSSVTANSCTINSLAGSVSATARFTLIVPIAPSAPTPGSASGGDGIVTVTFAPPASDGDAAVTGYTATCNPGSHTASGASAPLVVSGLTNGTGYDCSVTATNSAGTGAASAALHATPLATIAGPRAYMTTQAGTVSVFDAASNTVFATIAVNNGAQGLAVHPSGKRVYVANQGGNSGTTVTVIDATTNTVSNTVTVGTGPASVAFSPSGTRAYVTDGISNDIAVIDTAALTVVDSIPLATPSRIVVSPSGATLYVTSGASVHAIDVATHADTSIPLSGFAGGLALNSAGTRLYVAWTTSSTGLAVIDTSTNTVITNVGMGGRAGGVAVNPAGTRTYVGIAGSTVTLEAIDDTTNTALSSLDFGVGFGSCASFGCLPNIEVALDPAGTRVYVASGQFSKFGIVDAATGAYLTTVVLPDSPNAIAFAPPPLVISPFDLNDDGKSDLLWRNTADGSVQAWTMNGLTATGIAGLLPASGGYTVTHIADLNGDGFDDLLIRHTDGTVIAWLMNGLSVIGQNTLAPAGSGYTIVKVGDLNGDGKADILWQAPDGSIQAWLMDGLTPTSIATFVGAGSGWSPSQVADFDGDGKKDIIWQHTDGSVQLWLMNGLSVTGIASLAPASSGWSVVLTGDFNGDGKADLMWQHTNGATQTWLMNGLTVSGLASFTPAASGWTPVLAGDIDGDGKDDLFWQHTTGASQTWLMNGLTVTSLASFVAAGNWSATHLLDLNGDGKRDIFWRNTDGSVQAWLMNGLTVTGIASLAPPGTYLMIPPMP